MDIQRLRNLTTGRLHTDIGCVYEDLEELMGETGLMTHMLPRAMKAVTPWLKQHVKDLRFWDGAYDTSHTGELPLPQPTDSDRKEMRATYESLPDPLEGKTVIAATL